MPVRGFWELSATHTRRRPGDRGGPCPSAAGTRSSHGAPPGLSPPGQDLDTKSQENKDHIFPYEAERPALGKQWPCWDQRELGLDWGQKLSPSLIRMTASSPPPVTKVWGHAYRSLGAHPTFQPHPPAPCLPPTLHSSRNAA